MPRGSVFAKVMLLGSALAISLFTVEAVLRTGLVPNPRYEYLRTDGDTEDPETRVLLLGDSFVARRPGGGFHEELVSRLAPAGFEVVNLAVNGTGPEDYLEVLKEFGPDVKPDLTVVFYFAGNDLINVLRYQPYHATGPLAGIRDRLRPLVHRIYLYHAATEASSRVEFDFDAMLADGIDPGLVDLARTGEVNPWLLLIPAEDRARYLATNLELTSDDSRRGVERLAGIFAEMKQTTDALGSGIILIVFPETTQVSRSHFDFYQRAGFEPDPRTLVESDPQDMLVRLADPLRIPVLDLLPILRAAADEDLYRPNDSHLNERGDALAADHAARFIIANATHRGR